MHHEKEKTNYSQLHYEQELAAQKRRSKKHPEPVPEIIPGKEDPQTGILFSCAESYFRI